MKRLRRMWVALQAAIFQYQAFGPTNDPFDTDYLLKQQTKKGGK